MFHYIDLRILKLLNLTKYSILSNFDPNGRPYKPDLVFELQQLQIHEYIVPSGSTMEIKVAQNAIFSKIEKFNDSHINLVELFFCIFLHTRK